MTPDELIAELRRLAPADRRQVLAMGVLMEDAPAPVAPPESDEELLTVRQTAKLLGKSKSWLYHNWRELPFTVNGIGGQPRFSRRGLEKYIANSS